MVSVVELVTVIVPTVSVIILASVVVTETDVNKGMVVDVVSTVTVS